MGGWVEEDGDRLQSAGGLLLVVVVAGIAHCGLIVFVTSPSVIDTETIIYNDEES